MARQAECVIESLDLTRLLNSDSRDQTAPLFFADVVLTEMA